MAEQMPIFSNPSSPNADEVKGEQDQNYDALVRQVADRVWALWREELRRNRERFHPGSGRS